MWYMIDGVVIIMVAVTMAPNKHAAIRNYFSDSATKGHMNDITQ